METFSMRQRVEIGALIGVSLVAAFVLQNIEGWREKQVLQSTPTVEFGRVASINVLPSNVDSPHVVSLAMDDGSRVQLVASSELARRCKVGEHVALQRRGMTYHWANDQCDLSRDALPETP